MLVGFLVILAAVVAASSLSFVPWWSVAIPLCLIVAFLVVARRQVRRAEESFWVAASQQRPEPSNVVRRIATRVDASHGARKLAAGAGASDDPDEEPTVKLSSEAITAAAPELTEARVTAVALTTADGGSLWDPLPVTLPTYVDKPAARRTIRTIELGEPGIWSSGHSKDDSRTAATAPAAAEEAAEATSGPVAEARRAVNG